MSDNLEAALRQRQLDKDEARAYVADRIGSDVQGLKAINRFQLADHPIYSWLVVDVAPSQIE